MLSKDRNFKTVTCQLLNGEFKVTIRVISVGYWNMRFNLDFQMINLSGKGGYCRNVTIQLPHLCA